MDKLEQSYINRIKTVMIEAWHDGMSEEVIVGRVKDIASEVQEYGWEKTMEPVDWIKK